jgi:LPS export ABC transporter protein LptC
VSIRFTALLLLLLAAAGGSWYLSGLSRKPDTTELTSTPFRSGYYILDAVVRGTDADGYTRYEVRAAEATQAVRNTPIELRDIDVLYAAESDRPWTIRADAAQLDGDTGALRMSGNVYAQATTSAEQIPIELRTETLAFDPQQDQVETADKVQIRIGEGTLTATGLLASLRDDRIELRSNVSGKFTP